MTSGSSGSAQIRRPAFATERIIGASHVRSGKPCQDDVGVWSVGDLVAVAVADGHGSSRHADVGARLAVQVALETLTRFADDLGQRASSLTEVHRFAEHPLRVHVVREWAARVRSKAGREDVPLVDYGSTLLFALAAPEFLLIGQLGDGDVLLVGSQRQVVTPIPPDPSAFADETPSLCLHEAWHALRVRVLPAPREEALLLLSTDGYSKSYASDTVFHQIGPDYLDLVRTDGLHGLAPHLRGFLEQVTTQGSGDDIAVALLYWPARTTVAPSVSEPEASSEPAPPAEPLPSGPREAESGVTPVVEAVSDTPEESGSRVQVVTDVEPGLPIGSADQVPNPPVEAEKGDARTAEDG